MTPVHTYYVAFFLLHYLHSYFIHLPLLFFGTRMKPSSSVSLNIPRNKFPCIYKISTLDFKINTLDEITFSGCANKMNPISTQNTSNNFILDLNIYDHIIFYYLKNSIFQNSQRFSIYKFPIWENSRKFTRLKLTCFFFRFYIFLLSRFR